MLRNVLLLLSAVTVLLLLLRCFFYSFRRTVLDSSEVYATETLISRDGES